MTTGVVIHSGMLGDADRKTVEVRMIDIGILPKL